MGKDAEPKLYTQAEVEAIVAAATAPLLAKIEALELRIARMQRDSSTSSKPPSSDITKPPKGGPGSGGRGKKKRKPGGQRGHTRHERKLFKPDEIDTAWLYTFVDEDGLEPIPEDDPDEEAWRVVQQVEWHRRSLRIIEHRARRYRRVGSGRIVVAPLPEGIRHGELLAPGMTALIGYLKGACHLSYSSIQHFFREVMGIELCTGLLAKAVARASEALELPYNEVVAALPRQPVLGVDETGHRHLGQGEWAWCFQAPINGDDLGLTCFVIDPSRGSGVVKRMLGEEYGGVLVCDYFSAYRRCLDIMPNLRVQFCWSHLIRDLKFLLTLTALIAQKYGTRVLILVRRMFTLWHRRADLTPRHYERSMRRLRNDILKAAKSKSNHDEVRKLAKRLSSRFAESYFTFIDYLHLPGVEPTNNRTERQIRFVVIDRKVTQGTKGEVGKQWCQRIWTTIATCRQRGKQLYHFLLESIQAQLGIKRCHPSLIY